MKSRAGNQLIFRWFIFCLCVSALPFDNWGKDPSEAESNWANEDSDVDEQNQPAPDGLTNGYEAEFHLDPYNPDTDNDEKNDLQDSWAGGGDVTEEAKLRPKRLPTTQYANVRVSEISNTKIIRYVNSKGQAIVSNNNIYQFWDAEADQGEFIPFPAEAYYTSVPAGLSENGVVIGNYWMGGPWGGVTKPWRWKQGEPTLHILSEIEHPGSPYYNPNGYITAVAKIVGENESEIIIGSHWRKDEWAVTIGEKAYPILWRNSAPEMHTPPSYYFGPRNHGVTWWEIGRYTLEIKKIREYEYRSIKGANESGVLFGSYQQLGEYTTTASIYPEYPNDPGTSFGYSLGRDGAGIINNASNSQWAITGTILPTGNVIVDGGISHRVSGAPLAINSDGDVLGQKDLNNIESDILLWTKRIESEGTYLDPAIILRKAKIGFINSRLEIIGGAKNSGSDGPFLWQNYKLYQFGELFEGLEDFSSFEPKCINDDGVITAVGTPKKNDLIPDPQQQIMFVIPVDMAVDANRDGVIRYAGNFYSTSDYFKSKPFDKTTKYKPFRFWLNDDQDSVIIQHGSTSPPSRIEGETVPPKEEDRYRNSINFKRNLEDYARMHLYIGALQEKIQIGEIQVGMRWRTIQKGHPSIRIYQAAEPTGIDDYVKDEKWADKQISEDHFNLSIGTVSENDSFIFPTWFWQSNEQGLSAFGPRNSNRYVLFEGAEEGKGQLVLTFWKGSEKLGEGGGVWFDLMNIKKMYQRGKAEQLNIPPPQTAMMPYVGPTTYTSDNTLKYEPSADETNIATIFVHGWSMDYNYYINFSETMFKRLWHEKYKGRFCSFRWDPLVVNQHKLYAGEYNRSEHRAFVYAKALIQFVESIKADGFDVSLIGHSMGNIVCSSALQQGLTVQNYLLMEAAVPAGCYDESGGRDEGGVNGYDRFWIEEEESQTPDYHLAKNGDLHKGYRGFFKDVGKNANRIVNFHNQRDYALATGNKGGFETNWEKNEIDFKPDGNGATAWHYYYYYDRPLNERARLRINLLNGRDVTDSYEMKAFVSRPRSKAVGTVDESLGNLPGGAVQENVDLQTYGFDERDSDHSGQFNRRVHEVHRLYRDVKAIISPIQ